jgi:hypothetical protein
MSYFRSQLIASKISEASSYGRAMWRLQYDLEFYSDLYGPITVPAGFLTDFSSVPRIPLAFWLAGDTAHASAVVHDYLVRVEYDRDEIDWRTAADVFSEAMRAEGVPAWRRAIMHWAVMQADPSRKWEE